MSHAFVPKILTLAFILNLKYLVCKTRIYYMPIIVILCRQLLVIGDKFSEADITTRDRDYLLKFL